MHFENVINTFDNLDKYFLQFGQIHFQICTNTFCNLDKFFAFFAIWTNTFLNLYSHILQFRQIQFTIWTHPIYNLDKYNLQFGKNTITTNTKMDYGQASTNRTVALTLTWIGWI